jgi:hypothetical protein
MCCASTVFIFFFMLQRCLVEYLERRVETKNWLLLVRRAQQHRWGCSTAANAARCMRWGWLTRNIVGIFSARFKNNQKTLICAANAACAPELLLTICRSRCAPAACCSEHIHCPSFYLQVNKHIAWRDESRFGEKTGRFVELRYLREKLFLTKKSAKKPFERGEWFISQISWSFLPLYSFFFITQLVAKMFFSSWQRTFLLMIEKSS